MKNEGKIQEIENEMEKTKSLKRQCFVETEISEKKGPRINHNATLIMNDVTPRVIDVPPLKHVESSLLSRNHIIP